MDLVSILWIIASGTSKIAQRKPFAPNEPLCCPSHITGNRAEAFFFFSQELDSQQQLQEPFVHPNCLDSQGPWGSGVGMIWLSLASVCSVARAPRTTHMPPGGNSIRANLGAFNYRVLRSGQLSP